MAVTINTQGNVTPSVIAKESTKTTIITSGFLDGRVEYQIKSRDTQETITVDSLTSVKNSPNLVSISSSECSIILRDRIHYRARARRQSGAWTDWVAFKTRDKTYVTPSTVQLSDNNNENVAKTGSVTIRVTDTSRLGTVKDTARGATVNNTDKGYITTTNVTDTARGATVNNTE